MGASRYSFWNSVENAYMPDLEDGAPLSALKESGRLLEGSTPVQAVEVSGDEAASDPQTVIEPESPCASDIDVETLLEVSKTPVETALEMVGMDSVPSQTEQQRAFPMGASAYRSCGRFRVEQCRSWKWCKAIRTDQECRCPGDHRREAI